MTVRFSVQVTHDIECGEKHCYSKPGKSCCQLSLIGMNRPYCDLFDIHLVEDVDQLVVRNEMCIAAEKLLTAK